MQDSQVDEIRRKVEKRYKERQELIVHGAAFIAFNLLLWAIWLILNPTAFEMIGAEGLAGIPFPWPLIVTMGWAVGIGGHALDYYFKYGRGAERRQDAIDREIEQEMDRHQENGYLEKPKRDQHMRLTEDGELEVVMDEDEYSDISEDQRRA